MREHVEVEQVLCCNISGRRKARDPVRQLEGFVDEWSNKPSRKSHLEISKMIITRPLIHRLLPLVLLNHDASSSSFHNNNENTADRDIYSRHDTTNETPVLKLTSVKFYGSDTSFKKSDGNMLDHDNYVCTPDDSRSFLSALARFPLSFCYASKILLEFLSVCEIDHFKSQSLYILEEVDLLDSDFRKLGDMIQRNVQLTKLTLRLPLVPAPCAFYDSLANSIHIQVLDLSTFRYMGKTIPKLIVGEDGNGVVERLLRNPQSQLVEIDLCHTGLEDQHVMALAQLLPASKVKKINISCNKIHSQGLLEFVRQIPRMQSLQWIAFAHNPWEEYSDLEECGEALLHGLTENTSITFVNRLCAFPQYELLWHLLVVNFIRQKLLMFLPQSGEEKFIPDGLWPLILADTTTELADAVYFLLLNCPAILSYCKT